jgi:anti-sigma factor RsiW
MSLVFGTRAALQPSSLKPPAGSSVDSSEGSEPHAARFGWSQLLEASIAVHAPADGNVSLANAVTNWWNEAESQSRIGKARDRLPLDVQLDKRIGDWVESN